MYQRLRTSLKKQNDIAQFQRQKNIKKQQILSNQQAYYYGNIKFFSNCQQVLKGIAKDAQTQQRIVQHKRKMKIMKQIEEQQKQRSINQGFLLNMLIDYFRSQNLNYSYSTLMRQKNLISEQLMLKSQLVKTFNLNQQYQKQQRLNVSVIQLILKRIKRLEQTLNQNKQKYLQIGIQCQLLNKSNQSNNVLLSQIKIQQIRKQVQSRQKKYYQNQIHLFKSQQLSKIKQDLSKLYDTKQKKIVQKHQQRLKQITKNNLQSISSRKNTQTLQNYLNQITKLKQELRKQQFIHLILQKQKLQHDCFKNDQVKLKVQQISAQRKLLQQKKYEFQLALRNMDTKIQQLSKQKLKIMSDGQKQTQQFLSKVRQHKQNKDYMIQKVYGTIRGFQQRIQNLSKDNVKLLEDNQMLRHETTFLRKNLQQSRREEVKKKVNITNIKIPTKNISIGVTPQQIQPFDQQKSVVQSIDSAITYTSSQFMQKLEQKAQNYEKINKLKLQMDLLKNKVKYLVMDFE